MLEIEISRPRVNLDEESAASPKPFEVGEQLPKIYPHTGPTGSQHKGNFIVVEIYGNELGYKARTACSQNPCGVEVVVNGY